MSGARSPALASARPPSTSTSASNAPPTRKKAATETIAYRLDPVAVVTAANTAGPKMPLTLSITPKKPKN